MRSRGLAEPLRGRILVAQTAWLGDVALATSLLRGLRLALQPEAVDLLVGRPVQALLAGSPSVRRVLCLEKRGADRGLRGLLRFGMRLRGQYDAAIVPVRSWRTALLLAWARIPWRIGFEGHGARWFLHRAIAYPGQLHQVERLAALVPEIDWSTVGQRTELVVTAEEREAAKAKIQAAGLDLEKPTLALHPGSAWATKRWPADRFGEVLRPLIEEGWQGILIGAGEDRALGDAVLQAAGHPKAAVNLCGQTDLGVLKGVLQSVRLLLTNDSGPLHIAEALGTPVVGVFGSTHPRQGFAPRLAESRVVQTSLDCRPCGPHGRRVCPLGHFRCMLGLAAADVLASVRAVSAAR